MNSTRLREILRKGVASLAVLSIGLPSPAGASPELSRTALRQTNAGMEESPVGRELQDRLLEGQPAGGLEETEGRGFGDRVRVRVEDFEDPAVLLITGATAWVVGEQVFQLPEPPASGQMDEDFFESAMVVGGEIAEQAASLAKEGIVEFTVQGDRAVIHPPSGNVLLPRLVKAEDFRQFLPADVTLLEYSALDSSGVMNSVDPRDSGAVAEAWHRMQYPFKSRVAFLTVSGNRATLTPPLIAGVQTGNKPLWVEYMNSRAARAAGTHPGTGLEETGRSRLEKALHGSMGPIDVSLNGVRPHSPDIPPKKKGDSAGLEEPVENGRVHIGRLEERLKDLLNAQRGERTGLPVVERVYFLGSASYLSDEQGRLPVGVIGDPTLVRDLDLCILVSPAPPGGRDDRSFIDQGLARAPEMINGLLAPEGAAFSGKIERIIERNSLPDSIASWVMSGVGEYLESKEDGQLPGLVPSTWVPGASAQSGDPIADVKLYLKLEHLFGDERRYRGCRDRLLQAEDRTAAALDILAEAAQDNRREEIIGQIEGTGVRTAIERLTAKVQGAGLEEDALARAAADPEVRAALAAQGWAPVAGGYLAEADLAMAEPLILQAGLEEPAGLPAGAPVIRADETTVDGMLRFLEAYAQAGYNVVFSAEHFDLEQAQAAVPLSQPMPGSVLLAPGVPVHAKELGAALLISKRTGTLYVIRITEFTSPGWEKPLLYIRTQA